MQKVLIMKETLVLDLEFLIMGKKFFKLPGCIYRFFSNFAPISSNIFNYGKVFRRFQGICVKRQCD